MDINLKLTLDDVNGIMTTLGMLSFSQAHALIEKIREQAIVQVKAQQLKDETKAEETPPEAE